MTFQPLDIAAFFGFLALVVGVSLYASRGRHGAADYFLAGRSLPWWLIGFSLIASNISTEHFVGMAGRGDRGGGGAVRCLLVGVSARRLRTGTRRRARRDRPTAPPR